MGRNCTYIISTVYPGHENLWRLERVGDLERQRYLLVMANSKCVKDGVNQKNWQASVHPPLSNPNALSDLYRDESSRYVFICDRKLNQTMPVWVIELDGQS